MRRAVASLPPGWMMLSHCALGLATEPPARVRYALLHPKVGVALLDIVPDRPTPEPVERLRRALDRSEFRAIFGGWPPIVYRRLAPGQLPELGIVLATAFAFEVSLALDGGDAWVGSVLRALTARPADADPAPARVSEPRGPDGPGDVDARPDARGLRRKGKPIGAQAVLYGCLIVSALAGVLLLPGKEARLIRTERAAPPAPLPDLDVVTIPVLPPPGLPAAQHAASAVAPALAPDEMPVPERASPAAARASTRPRPIAVGPSDGNALNERCQSIILKAQLGEEPSDADRAYLRRGCARR